MNDQSIKADAGKPRLTLVPQQILYDVAEIREYGVKNMVKKKTGKVLKSNVIEMRLLDTFLLI